MTDIESLKKRGQQVARGALVVAGLAGFVAMQQRPAPEPLALVMPTATATVVPTATVAPLPVVVYVSGEVVAPGVYTLPPASRVVDAIAAAGGLGPEAEPSAINQALPLQDGMQIHVPRAGEAPTPAPLSQAEARSGAKLNINTANAEELEALPEIGPSLAGAIVRHREANGPFATVDDLLAVPGIGDATLDAIRELVTVE